jgi:hypothetical protein
MTKTETQALVDSMANHDDSLQWRENPAYRDGLILNSLAVIAKLLAELLDAKGA